MNTEVAMTDFTHLKKWEHPECYFGATFYDYYVVTGQHRDSDLLTQSNFDTLLKRLGGESETVIVVRSDHWAVGWVEGLYVHETDTKRLEIAEELLESLEQYPVLDEEDWTEREEAAADDYWLHMDVHERVWWCKEYHVSIFAARRAEVPDDPTGDLVAALAA